jgi:hypothetical protein
MTRAPGPGNPRFGPEALFGVIFVIIVLIGNSCEWPASLFLGNGVNANANVLRQFT